jgi:hypothetical protein
MKSVFFEIFFSFKSWWTLYFIFYFTLAALHNQSTARLAVPSISPPYAPRMFSCITPNRRMHPQIGSHTSTQ